MARTFHRAVGAIIVVALVHGGFALDMLKPEAAPQTNGLLLPTGAPPGSFAAGVGLLGLPANTATDPLSVKPVGAVPPLQGQPAARPAALPGALPGPMPGLAAPGGFPAAQPVQPVLGFPVGGMLPGFGAPGPLLPAAAGPLPTLPPAQFPTSLPGDGVMGRGGPAVIPGVTPAAGPTASKEMIGGSSFDSVFGSSVSSLGIGSSLGDPFGSTTMAGSGTLGTTGTLGGSGALSADGSMGGSGSPLRNRRAANSAHGTKLAKGLAGLLLVAAMLVL